MDTTDLEMTSSLHKYNFPKWMKFGLNFVTPNFDEISPSSGMQIPTEDKDIHTSPQTTHHWQTPDEPSSGPLPPGVDMKPNPHASVFSPIPSTKQSAESSAETTPSSSPPGSPVLSNRPSNINSSSTQFNSRGISPVQWIFQGFFPFSQTKPDGLSFNVESQQNNKNAPSAPDNTKTLKQKFSFPLISHKKYNISNFDMNALSPTSW